MCLTIPRPFLLTPVAKRIPSETSTCVQYYQYQRKRSMISAYITDRTFASSVTHFTQTNDPTLVTKMQDDCPPNSERSSTQVAECEVVKNVGSRSIRKPLEIRLNDEFSFSFSFFFFFPFELSSNIEPATLLVRLIPAQPCII